MEYLSILDWAIAAMFSAFMDTLDHHFDSSIFRKLNPKWWRPDVSWNHVPVLPFTKYRPDAWHIGKTLELTAIILTVYFAFKAGMPEWMLGWHDLIQVTFFLTVYGLVWIYSFNLFYNKLFLAKTYGK